MMARRITSPKEQGYIALLSILIIGAVALAIALNLLLTGSDASRSTLYGQQSAQARSLAVACAEEALQLMHDTTTFTGTNTLNIGQGSCSYTVANTGGSSRTIDTTATVGTVVRKIKIYATISSSSISITSWQEVG